MLSKGRENPRSPRGGSVPVLKTYIARELYRTLKTIEKGRE
jgi:hypothetical protein